MKIEFFFILVNRFLLQMAWVSGVKAQHTARKSDCFATSSKETKQTARFPGLSEWSKILMSSSKFEM